MGVITSPSRCSFSLCVYMPIANICQIFLHWFISLSVFIVNTHMFVACVAAGHCE